ncbi:ComF family protein [Neisseria dentiae]|uniref:ComF family protein n=1 Tax=Neisseria dentiae TaxID=194197 RepID=UPI0035A068DC
MQVEIKELYGIWDKGYALNKHTKSSECIGYNEYGYPIFNTIRTDVGEALYQLKYKQDKSQIKPLADCLAQNIYPLFERVGFIVPMPASTERIWQPVTEIVNELSKIVNIPCFNSMLLKQKGRSLKDLNDKEEKIQALNGTFSLIKNIKNDGKWNVLLIDDVFHTGASMEVASNALKTYEKIDKVYITAITWR